MPDLFIPKKGQSVRLKPLTNPHSILNIFTKEIGTVVSIEDDKIWVKYFNGRQDVEGHFPVAYANRGANIKFANHPNTFRIPLEFLSPA
jgi:hypothetical protein